MKKLNFKAILFVYQIVIFTTFCNAETIVTVNFINDKNIIFEGDKINQNDEVYTDVDVIAEFPGGAEILQKYITVKLKYPKEAVKQKRSGKVYVQFIINKEGEVKNVKVVKGVCSSLDAEAVRVIESLPKWEPAKIDNKPVSMKFTIPINFVL